MSITRADYTLSSSYSLPTDLIFHPHVIQIKGITCPISGIMGNRTIPRIWGQGVPLFDQLAGRR